MIREFYSKNVTNILKTFFSIFALLLLTVHLIQPALQIDTISLGLLLAIALPWLSHFIKSAKLPGGWEFEFQELKTAVENQQEMINTLVRYSMSASVFTHLCGIAILKSYKYNNDESFRREMYYLRDGSYIKPKSWQFLVFDDNTSGKNLADLAELTPTGWICVKLRKNEIPSNMLTDKDNLRLDPNTL